MWVSRYLRTSISSENSSDKRRIKLTTEMSLLLSALEIFNQQRTSLEQLYREAFTFVAGSTPLDKFRFTSFSSYYFVA